MAYGFKTGGRQKGTLNKTTQQVRENCQTLLMEEMDTGHFREMLYQLAPKDYMAVMLKMFPFTMPKARPEDCFEVPHGANEFAAKSADTAEEPPVQNAGNPDDPAPRERLRNVINGELERFRLHMGWSEEQFKRFAGGEPIESVNAKQ